MVLTLVLILICGGFVYWCWIRPILQKKPTFADFYARETSFFAAFKLKFAGLKQKLTTAFVTFAGLVVALHDWLAPLVSGIDTTAYAAMVPTWVWPLIPVGITLLVQYFRNLSERRNGTEAV